jgi:hypothetical protein
LLATEVTTNRRTKDEALDYLRGRIAGFSKPEARKGANEILAKWGGQS